MVGNEKKLARRDRVPLSKITKHMKFNEYFLLNEYFFVFEEALAYLGLQLPSNLLEGN